MNFRALIIIVAIIIGLLWLRSFDINAYTDGPPGGRHEVAVIAQGS